jgi:DNA-directed RNA polymerase specialized sigma24 family protein
MILMTEFKQIVQLRNLGKTQKEIAAELGLSERTIRNYLKSGSIPCYERTVPTKKYIDDRFKMRKTEPETN